MLEREYGPSYSWAAKGLAISSRPSTGLRSVIVGPRKTVSPRDRVCGVGSVIVNKQTNKADRRSTIHAPRRVKEDT